MVGSLIYLTSCTRPDLCFIVSTLSQYLSKPTYAHLNLCKNVLRYLKGTLDYGLTFKPIGQIKIVGYSDASWANAENRKSISGFAYSLSDDTTLISWKSKKQPTVALSTCESEYIAMTLAMQEGIFISQLLKDIGMCSGGEPVILYIDNKGAIDLAKNPVHHQRTKHVDIKYHFIRTKVQDGSFILKYVPSKSNIADLFTKPLPRTTITGFNIVSVC